MCEMAPLFLLRGGGGGEEPIRICDHVSKSAGFLQRVVSKKSHVPQPGINFSATDQFTELLNDGFYLESYRNTNVQH